MLIIILILFFPENNLYGVWPPGGCVGGGPQQEQEDALHHWTCYRESSPGTHKDYSKFKYRYVWLTNVLKPLEFKSMRTVQQDQNFRFEKETETLFLGVPMSRRDRDFFLLSLNVETRLRLFSPKSQCRDETETFSSWVSMSRHDRDLYIRLYYWVSM